MEQTKNITISFLPANNHAARTMLAKHEEVFTRNIMSFWGSRDHHLMLPTERVVLEVPELNARLRLPAAEGQSTHEPYLQVWYSFAPNLEEVAGANHYYMAKTAHIESWSNS